MNLLGSSNETSVGIIAAILLVVIIGVAAGISASKHKQDAKSDSSRPSNANLNGISESSIPASAKGTYLDPFTWYDTTDFNVTYTADQVGGLSVMGLDSSWNDNVRANPTVPPLTERWEYGKRSIRGVNLGGWLSLEPFIVPSLFNTTYPNLANPSIPGPPYIDEWSLTSALGPAASLALLDKHYSSFAPTSTFAAIRAAGFDHIRIPFSYWAVTTYPGDPYVQHISWRYLLCGIEYARQNGLRVNLDLHAAPGSQNGWNHSGRQGAINWLSGTDGALNAERTLAIHAQLATFFAQPRYANVVTLYGVLNEPNMELLPPTSVLNWTTTALTQLRRSPLPNTIILVISNGFLPLPFWHAALAPTFPDPSASRILLDAHQYVIFNPDQLSLNHTAKLSYACDGWAQQTAASMSSTTGFGNFLCGEWSQADTDCAKYINDVGYGARWDGTLDTGNAETSVLTPACSLGDARCSCATANALPSSYSSSYKRYLRAFADAQMRSFGTGWGWFYWTWDVEEGPGAAQLSWKKGVEAGILPKDVSSASDGGRFGCQGEEVNVAGSYWEGVGLGEGF